MQLNQYITTSTTGSNKENSSQKGLDFDYNHTLNILLHGTNNSTNTATTSASTTLISSNYNTIIREQRKIVKQWLETIFQLITIKCKYVLSNLKNAAEVAKLQELVYKTCVQLDEVCIHNNSGSNNNTNSSSGNNKSSSILSQYNYTQHNWYNACMNIFTTTTTTPTTTPNTTDTTITSYLWNNVFQSCFLHQVERLLKNSCNHVLVDTKTHLLHTLKQIGINIDYNTLKLYSTSTTSSGNNTKYSDVSQISSPFIYKLAEKIRKQFETDLLCLLADIIDPVSGFFMYFLTYIMGFICFMYFYGYIYIY